jgi:hypothetical protein
MADDEALDYIESLLVKLLAMMTAKPVPSTVQDIEVIRLELVGMAARIGITEKTTFRIGFRGATFQCRSLGVDVMITIFCDFCQFSAKKLAFFSKTNVMIKTLQKLAVV